MRLVLIVISDLIGYKSKTRVSCPICGHRLFELTAPAKVSIGLATAEQLAQVNQKLKCERCGRTIGIIFKTE